MAGAEQQVFGTVQLAAEIRATTIHVTRSTADRFQRWAADSRRVVAASLPARNATGFARRHYSIALYLDVI